MKNSECTIYIMFKVDGYRSLERKRMAGKNTAGTVQFVHVLQNNLSPIFFHL